jgi:hypothetical protein
MTKMTIIQPKNIHNSDQFQENPIQSPILSSPEKRQLNELEAGWKRTIFFSEHGTVKAYFSFWSSRLACFTVSRRAWNSKVTSFLSLQRHPVTFPASDKKLEHRLHEPTEDVFRGKDAGTDGMGQYWICYNYRLDWSLIQTSRCVIYPCRYLKCGLCGMLKPTWEIYICR